MGLPERCIARLADDRTPKLAVTKTQLERMEASLEGVVPLREFKELRAVFTVSRFALSVSKRNSPRSCGCLSVNKRFPVPGSLKRSAKNRANRTKS